MTGKFINRERELAELDLLSKKHGLLVLYGRRRLGKSRLLNHWISTRGGLYTQAVEGNQEIQLLQIYEDIKNGLEIEIVPKSWTELWSLLENVRSPLTFCIDEFPYLVATNPSLPSLIQKLFDHRKKTDLNLILSGSSNRMMHDIFLNSSAPLFGRAMKCLHLEPMSYPHFCKATSSRVDDIDSFAKYSLVGGVPKYWEFIEKGDSSIDCADKLYFDYAPYMESEPRRVLSDELIAGMGALSILEVIGRGAEKPSEIAARLNTPQTNISRVLQQLVDASIICRDYPFGLSSRDTKRTLYKITDPAMRFWYRGYSPHRTTWRSLSKESKKKIIYDHASTVFEDFIRQQFDSSARFWNSQIEIDVLYTTGERAVSIGEVKFSKLSSSEKRGLESALRNKFEQSELARKYTLDQVTVYDLSFLKTLLN